MPPEAQPIPSVSVTVVTAPGCHLCDEVRLALDDLIRGGAPLDVFLVDAGSAAGLALIGRHRPALNPLVLVEGEYFSAGRLPRRRLLGFVERRRSAGLVAGHG